MSKINKISKANRREFLTTMLPAGTFICLGCPSLLAINNPSPAQEQLKNDHKFQNEFCRTHEEAFRWRFGYFIDQMEILSDSMGKEKVTDMLKTAAYNSQLKKASTKSNITLSDFVNKFKTNEFYNSTLTYEVLKESDNEFVVKSTECLWAKTFLDRNAGDIGYASICYGEIGYAKGYNSKLEMVKNLMLGDDCCLKRYSVEV